MSAVRGKAPDGIGSACHDMLGIECAALLDCSAVIAYVHRLRVENMAAVLLAGRAMGSEASRT